MSDIAIGAFLLNVFLGIVAIIVAAIIMRAVFRINRIVDLLSSIDSRLKSNGIVVPRGPSTQSISAADSQADGTVVEHGETVFGMAITEISAGDELETPEGKRWIVTEFKRKGLQVKDDSGRIDILLPSNPDSSSTLWKFNVRKARS